MIKKSVIFAILYCVNYYLFAQKEASNWYFGDNAGIHFNADSSITELTNGQLSTIEGCSSISDVNGNLLFYTDGITVWNKLHQPMPNANGTLNKGLFGDPSSTQSAIVAPKPNDPNIYYIFTNDTSSTTDEDPDQGFNYSIVDMTLNGGLGDITLKNINLLEDSSEKITAVVKDCMSQDVWVITYASVNGEPENFFTTFHAYLITNSGVNKNPVSSTFTTEAKDPRGYLKLSPDGTKLISANAASGLYLYNFDKTTGIVSNEIEIQINFSNNNTKPQVPYGVEFSQNSALLYVSTFFRTDWDIFDDDPSVQYGALLQYDLNAINISSSETVIDHRQTFRSALQLGPNGKIYRTMSATYDTGTNYLSVINNPNTKGLNCNYENNAIHLSRNSRQGLPPFITSFFSEKIDIIKNDISTSSLNLCAGDTYTLSADSIPNATYIWKRNGIILLTENNYETSSTNDFEFTVTTDGLYEVSINPNTENCSGFLEGLAYVTYSPLPVSNNHTLIQCDEDGIPGGFTRFNLNKANTHLTLGVSDRSVKFYKDILRTDEIINSNTYNYDTDNPHLIYAKIINNDTDCSSNSELTLQVSTTEIANFIATPECDDLDSEDGINNFNLDSIKLEIQSLNNFTYPITFFESYDDALLEQNVLDSHFTNTKAYSQTIYARVENENNCYSISEVLLTINRLPNIIEEAIILYCINKQDIPITLIATVVNDTPNNYTYNWSTGDSTYDIEITQPGIYSVEVTNTNNCSKTRTITVSHSNIATIESIKIVDGTQNNSITVLTSGEGIYEYQLQDESNNTVYAPYQESNIFKNIQSGIYTVTVKDVKNNCGITPPHKVAVIGFPKFFTPNGDGKNDTWQVYGVSSMFQPNSKIRIFNRHGKLLKQLSPTEKGWDGTLNGDTLPNDDYWFCVKLQDGRLFRSHFTLKH